MATLGKYQLLDRIAVGGMAEIYRAKSLGIEGFEKLVALKRILPDLAIDHDFITMFVEEAKIAGQLSHANIAPIYELGKIDDSHFIAMEYVFGKDLLQIITRFKRMRRVMPPQMAAWIAAKVLEGLDYAHRKRGPDGSPLGIIHRDVSPQNILVSYEGLVKLIDFGIAKAASRATQTRAGVLKGKLGYMSPEQVRGFPMDHRSDVFAASACLHEMLTGERLFSGNNDIEVLDAVRRAAVTPPSQLGIEIPAELEQILMKGLAREPADRWQTAGEMQEALARVVALTRPPFGTAKLSEWMRTAFASDIANEKARLDQLLGAPSAQPAPAPSAPSAPSAAQRPSEDGVVEYSQLVEIEESKTFVAPPPAMFVPPTAVHAPPTAVHAPAVQVAPAVEVAPYSLPAWEAPPQPEPYQAPPAYQQQPQYSPEPYQPAYFGEAHAQQYPQDPYAAQAYAGMYDQQAHAAQYAEQQAWGAPASTAPTEVSRPAMAAVAPPHLSAAVFEAPPKRKRGRLGCILFMLFLLFLTGGAVAVWFFVPVVPQTVMRVVQDLR